MTRQAVLVVGGSVVLLLAVTSVALRSSEDGPTDQWIVAVHADDDRTYDEPCVPSPDGGTPVQIVGHSASTSGGEYNGLTKVRSQADGEALARCYEAHDIEAKVRTMSESDRTTWEAWGG